MSAFTARAYYMRTKSLTDLSQSTWRHHQCTLNCSKTKNIFIINRLHEATEKSGKHIWGLFSGDESAVDSSKLVLWQKRQPGLEQADDSVQQEAEGGEYIIATEVPCCACLWLTFGRWLTLKWWLDLPIFQDTKKSFGVEPLSSQLCWMHHRQYCDCLNICLRYVSRTTRECLREQITPSAWTSLTFKRSWRTMLALKVKMIICCSNRSCCCSQYNCFYLRPSPCSG